MYNIDNISSIFDNEEDYIEFLLALKKTNDKDIRYTCEILLEDKGYCCRCGTKLQTLTYREPHPEVEGYMTYETFTVEVCPECDIVNNKRYGDYRIG